MNNVQHTEVAKLSRLEFSQLFFADYFTSLLSQIRWAPCIKKGVQVRVLKQKLSYEYPGVKTNGGSYLLKRVSRPYFLKWNNHDDFFILKAGLWMQFAKKMGTLNGERWDFFFCWQTLDMFRCKKLGKCNKEHEIIFILHLPHFCCVHCASLTV